MKFDPLHASQNSLTTALVCLEPRSLFIQHRQHHPKPNKQTRKKELTP